MKKLKFGYNFVVFLLFFGISLIEAVQNKNLLEAVFWLVIGIFFLMADNLKK